jgi:4-hydroxy-tetrahydrodipicolinate reductase
MKKIYLMIKGIPGKFALTIAAQTINYDRYTLVPFSLTGPDIEE